MLDKHLKELRRLYGKFREGTLTPLEALNGYLFFYIDGIPLLIAGFALWFIDVENQVEKDQRILWVTAFFFSLFFIKWMILFSRTLPKKPTLLIRVYRALGSIIFAAGFSYVSGMGYFIFWNAVSGNGQKVLVSGPVVHMRIGSAGRFSPKPYFVTLNYDDRNIEVTVPPEEYVQLSPGQTYYRKMYLGGLGYYYNWGSSWWK